MESRGLVVILLLGDAGVIIVPAGPLASVPWNLLPDLRGRPVTVCPSASSWMSAWRRRPPSVVAPDAVRPLLVAGPDLAHAAAEVTAIAKIYPGARPPMYEIVKGKVVTTYPVTRTLSLWP